MHEPLRCTLRCARPRPSYRRLGVCGEPTGGVLHISRVAVYPGGAGGGVVMDVGGGGAGKGGGMQSTIQLSAG